jgi:hypothetical protein
MGSFYSNPHEEYVDKRLTEAYCMGLSHRQEVFDKILVYCDEHPEDCRKIKVTVEECIIDLKLRPIF